MNANQQFGLSEQEILQAKQLLAIWQYTTDQSAERAFNKAKQDALEFLKKALAETAQNNKAIKATAELLQNRLDAFLEATKQKTWMRNPPRSELEAETVGNKMREIYKSTTPKGNFEREERISKILAIVFPSKDGRKDIRGIIDFFGRFDKTGREVEHCLIQAMDAVNNLNLNRDSTRQSARKLIISWANTRERKDYLMSLGIKLFDDEPRQTPRVPLPPSPAKKPGEGKRRKQKKEYSQQKPPAPKEREGGWEIRLVNATGRHLDSYVLEPSDNGLALEEKINDCFRGLYGWQPQIKGKVIGTIRRLLSLHAGKRVSEGKYAIAKFPNTGYTSWYKIKVGKRGYRLLLSPNDHERVVRVLVGYHQELYRALGKTTTER